MEILLTSEGLIALLTLTFLEIVLGAKNPKHLNCLSILRSNGRFGDDCSVYVNHFTYIFFHAKGAKVITPSSLSSFSAVFVYNFFACSA